MSENETEPEQQPVPAQSTSRVRIAMLMTASFIAGVLATLLVPAVMREREAAEIERCAENLKQFALLFKIFSNEHKMKYPPPSRVPGRFFPDWEEVYPDYLDDPYIATCQSDVTVPSDAEVATSGKYESSMWDDYSYIYFGYAITGEEEGFAFLEAYEQKVTEAIQSEKLTFVEQSGEWLLPISFWENSLYVGEKRGYENGDRVFRLEEDPNLFSNWDGMSPITPPPIESFIVMLDRPGSTTTDFNHPPGGANVLNTLGRVEYVTQPSDEFVLSPRFIQEFLEMEACVEKLYADFVKTQEK